MSEAVPPTNLSATTSTDRASSGAPPAPPAPPAGSSSTSLNRRERRAAKKAGTKDASTKQVSKVSKWNRPRPPLDWRWWVGGFGKVLIAVGLLMFGFVAYQLWGTGIETARAQRGLESEFEDLIAGTDLPPGIADSASGQPSSDPVVSTESNGDGSTVVVDSDEADGISPDTNADTTTAVPLDEQVLPPIEEGDAVARIEVPEIGVNDIVVAGVARDDLKRGPGHFPETPLPGQLGNVAIAGHRTTYGQPFHDVDKLEPGDDVVMTTPNGTFVYSVVGTQIVAPSDYQVIATSDPEQATLTLVSCHPKWTTRERIVVTAELDPLRSNDIGEPTVNYGRPITQAPAAELPGDPDLPGDESIADGSERSDATASDDRGESSETAAAEDGETTVTGSFDNEPAAAGAVPGSAEVNAVIADAFAAGWFSDPGANSQVAMWGLIVSAIAALAYLLSRTLRRDWVGALVGIVPFAVALYFFFQNVNRLLPPAL